MSLDGNNGRRSIGTLLRDLVEESVSLVRDEVHLAKLEVTRAVAGIGRGTAYTAIGAVFVVLGVLALVVGLVLLAGDQWIPADRYWLAAMLVMVITGVLTMWFARRGLALLSPSHLAPRETVTTLKEDKEWLKQRLTSDATSN
jgi:uncharacterized membrane protein YqjE